MLYSWELWDVALKNRSRANNFQSSVSPPEPPVCSCHVLSCLFNLFYLYLCSSRMGRAKDGFCFFNSTPKVGKGTAALNGGSWHLQGLGAGLCAAGTMK